MAVPVQITFDCLNPDALSRFWAALLEYHLPNPPDGHATWQEFLKAQNVPEDAWNDASAAEDPEGRGPRLFFQRVPESKQVKNRVHLDVNVGGPRGAPAEERRTRVEAAVERAGALGATRVGDYEKYGERWIVMQDPEGNEFCFQ